MTAQQARRRHRAALPRNPAEVPDLPETERMIGVPAQQRIEGFNVAERNPRRVTHDFPNETRTELPARREIETRVVDHADPAHRRVDEPAPLRGIERLLQSRDHARAAIGARKKPRHRRDARQWKRALGDERLATAPADDDPDVIRPRPCRGRHFEKRPHGHADKHDIADLRFDRQRHVMRFGRTGGEKTPPARVGRADHERLAAGVDNHTDLARVNMARGCQQLPRTASASCARA
ncbi:hypothetical protein EMIT0111MI5_290008 [Burkholderia sp. IT-111MI5]